MKLLSDLEITMNLKKQLNLILQERGMTASELARRAKVPKQSISGWMAGSNPRDVRQIKKVADVLGISLDHLLFGSGIKAKPFNEGVFDQEDETNWIGGIFEVKLRRIRK